MTTAIPESHAYLLQRQTRAHATLALVLQDGTPQVSPLWFDYQDGLFIINTARGRVKDKALHRQPYAALCILDPVDIGRYLLVRGPVVVETEEGAWDQIDDLNLKYNGNRSFTRRPGQVRVTYKIKPEHVFGGT
jgi:PPOX class probable F420-dependent enzyme